MAKSKFFIKPIGDEALEAGTNTTKRVIFNKGYQVKQGGILTAYNGGLYDTSIFGQRRMCKCRKVKEPGHYCSFCDTYVFDDKTDKHLYGLYELPVHIVNMILLKNFIAEFNKAFPGYFDEKIETEDKLDIYQNFWNRKIIPEEVVETKNDHGVYVTRIADGQLCKLKFGVYSREDPISYFGFYGFNGIFNILNNYKSSTSNFDELKKSVTKYLIIAPVSMRMPGRKPNGDVVYPRLTQMYSMIIETCRIFCENTLDTSTASLADRLMCAYTINMIYNKGIKEYELIKPSKQSLIRYSLTTNLTKSGRANIISTDEPINVIKLPKSLAYEALKTDILEALYQRYGNDADIEQMYRNPKQEVMDIFKEIVEDSVVVINRQPSLHKYSCLAFHPKLWEDDEMISSDNIAAIGLNVQIVEPFNADFDGDQMQFWFATKEPEKTDIYNKMCVEHNWFYEKDFEPVFKFKKSLLAGLYLASSITPKTNPDDIKTYDSSIELFNDYRFGLVEFDEEVKVDGVRTSYGREKIKSIIGQDLDEILDKPIGTHETINGKTISKLMTKLASYINKIEVVNDLYNLSKEIVTVNGTQVAPSGELYKLDLEFPQIKAIVDSNMDEKEKWVKIDEILPKLIDDKIKENAPELHDYVSNGSGIKSASLHAILGPQVNYNFRTGKVEIVDESFITGLSEDSMIHHIESSREILKQKAMLVPQGGDLTTQLSNLCSGIIYKESIESEDTIGILTKEKFASGRETIDGNIIPDNTSDKLVRIKSCVTSPDQTGFIVARNEISAKFFDTYNRDNQMIGVSFITGFTEALTQQSLGLKHGGTMFKPDHDALVINDEACVTDINDDNIVVLVDGTKYTYPLPTNALLTKEAKEIYVAPGHPIFYLDKPVYIDFNVVSMLTFMKARKGTAKFDVNRTVLEAKSVYALTEGTIHYDFKNRSVHVGSDSYPMYDDEIYYYPDGAKVNFGDRICSGVCNINEVINKVSNRGDAMYIILRQFEDFNFKLKNTEAIEFVMKRKYFTGRMNVVTATKSLDYMSAVTGGYTVELLSNAVGTYLDDSLNLRLILDRGNVEGLGEQHDGIQ